MFGRATITLGIGPHSSFIGKLFLKKKIPKIVWKMVLFMVALCNEADHYIFMLWFVLLSLFFFFLA